jgi:DNA transformation protein
MTDALESERLEDLLNIGPALANDLRKVGIPDATTLRDVGADEANRRLGAAGLNDCSSAQRSIIGAIAGVHYTKIPKPMM